jgi:hypothetical protein
VIKGPGNQQDGYRLNAPAWIDLTDPKRSEEFAAFCSKLIQIGAKQAYQQLLDYTEGLADKIKVQ